MKNASSRPATKSTNLNPKPASDKGFIHELINSKPFWIVVGLVMLGNAMTPHHQAIEKTEPAPIVYADQQIGMVTISGSTNPGLSKRLASPAFKNDVLDTMRHYETSGLPCSDIQEVANQVVDQNRGSSEVPVVLLAAAAQCGDHPSLERAERFAK